MILQQTLYMHIKLMKSLILLKFSSNNVFMFTHDPLKKCYNISVCLYVY